MEKLDDKEISFLLKWQKNMVAYDKFLFPVFYFAIIVPLVFIYDGIKENIPPHIVIGIFFGLMMISIYVQYKIIAKFLNIILKLGGEEIRKQITPQEADDNS